MRKLPEIGKFYDCYDDGKIHESRKYKVKIISIIPFEKHLFICVHNGERHKIVIIGYLQEKRTIL